MATAFFIFGMVGNKKYFGIFVFWEWFFKWALNGILMEKIARPLPIFGKKFRIKTAPAFRVNILKRLKTEWQARQIIKVLHVRSLLPVFVIFWIVGNKNIVCF